MAPDPFLSLHNLPTGVALVVAISGGSDSLALLLLASEFASRENTPLLAVTVDHALRAESAAEARAVAALCHERGIAHRTMVWRGDKPASGLSAAARDARYGLLAEAARDFGATIVLTGHTMDDQAETVAMRRKRGAGSGLSGMAHATLFDGDIWIVRPLLGVRREALRGYLHERQVGWIDDPSNRNPAFERVRVRAALTEPEIAALAGEALAAGQNRRVRSATAAALVQRHASQPSPGLFRFDKALFETASDAALLALRALLATVGGTPHLPDASRAGELFARLAADENLRATLSRTVIDRRRSGIWLLREARDVPAITLTGAPAIWDGRWRVSGDAGRAEGAQPKGDARMGVLPRNSDGDAPFPPASLVRAAQALLPRPPAGVSAFIAQPVVAPCHRFLPDFDLKLAAALAQLVGATLPSALPWKHHIDE